METITRPVPPKRERVAKQLSPMDTVGYQGSRHTVMEIDQKHGILALKDPSEPKIWIRDVKADEVEVYGFDAREAIFGGGSWVRFPAALRLLGNPAQESLLAFLMNHHWSLGRKRKWFYATTSTIVALAYITPSMVPVLLNRLEAAGFIKRKRRPGDRRRYICICYDVIQETLETLKRKWRQEYASHCRRCNVRAG